MYLVSVTVCSEDGCSSYAKLPIKNEDWTLMGVNERGTLLELLATSALTFATLPGM